MRLDKALLDPSEVYRSRRTSGRSMNGIWPVSALTVIRGLHVAVPKKKPSVSEAGSMRTERKFIRTMILFLILSLVGCGAEPAGDVTVNGQLTVAGNPTFPSGVRAKVSIVEQRPDGFGARIIAERSLHDLRRVPVRFSIALPRALIESDAHYVFEAQILNTADEPLWITRRPSALQPLAQKRPATLYLTAR